MATLAPIDISGLVDYVQDPGVVIGKLLNRDSVLSMLPNYHTGVHPGKWVHKFYEGGGNIGDCCGDRPGGGEFTQKLFDIACFSFGNEFCPDDLNKLLKTANARYTAGNKSLGSVEAIIMDQELASSKRAIDKVIFQGDTSLADKNLNKIDGLIKQALAIDTAPGNYTTGNVYQAFNSFVRSLPLEIYDGGDIAVFADPNIVTALNAIVVGKNFFNYTPQNVNPYTPITIPGIAGVTIYPQRGMLGTGYMIATPLTNVHWFTNLADDYMTASWDWSGYHKKFFWDIEFILGIGYGIDEWVKIAKVDDDVINTEAGLPVDIISPRNAAGDALQTEEKA